MSIVCRLHIFLIGVALRYDTSLERLEWKGLLCAECFSPRNRLYESLGA